MFKVNDYIVYGSAGVCRVESVGPMSMGGSANGKDFYTLEPVYEKGSRVFTPVDNNKVIMRPILSQKESNQLIDEIVNIEILVIEDEKNREDIYKDALRKCDCKEWIRVIKTLHERILNRAEQGKKATSSDEKYLHLAKECLYGELAFSLDIPKEDVETFILDRIEGNVTPV